MTQLSNYPQGCRLADAVFLFPTDRGGCRTSGWMRPGLRGTLRGSQGPPTGVGNHGQPCPAAGGGSSRSPPSGAGTCNCSVRGLRNLSNGYSGNTLEAPGCQGLDPTRLVLSRGRKTTLKGSTSQAAQQSRRRGSRSRATPPQSHVSAPF